MKLERFTKNKKRKTFIIGAIIGICVSIGGIFLYKSYAYYENEKEYNVIKGIIPDFSYDVKFAIEVDGTSKDTIPKSTDKGTNNNYYRVKATCDDGITAEWDYNAWNLKVEDIQKGTKCKLAFTSDLTTTERDELLKKGVSERRNTYRGEDITKYIEGTQINGRNLYEQISDCTFDDIYVGDYIVDKKSGKQDINNQQIKYLVADINNYMNTGDSGHELTKCHVTMIPAAPLVSSAINSTNSTEGGYASSSIIAFLDSTILNQYLIPVFSGDHLINYRNYLTTAVASGVTNRIASEGIYSGMSTSANWYDRRLDLMDEVSVTGNSSVSSSMWDRGIDTSQYAIFQLRPEMIGVENSYGLKDVASAITYVVVSKYGLITHVNAHGATGIRPRFLVG